MLFKRILGFIFLLCFVGFMGYRFYIETEYLQNNMLLIGFLVAVVLGLVLVVRKILHA